MTFKVGDRVLVNNSIFNDLGVFPHNTIGTVEGLVEEDTSKLWVRVDDEFEHVLVPSPLPLTSSEVEAL